MSPKITIPTLAAEFRHVLETHRTLAPEDQPAWRLRPVTWPDRAALFDEFGERYLSACVAVVARCLLGVEQLLDAEGQPVQVGEPGTPAREAFMRQLPSIWGDELASAIWSASKLPEGAEKN